MKVANHSWWIGAIIGAILTLTLIGGQAEDNPGMLITIGLLSGAFCGWLIGLIIDKARGNSNKGILDSNENNIVENKETNAKEPIKNSKNFYGLSAQLAHETVKIINGGNNMISILISINQPTFDDSISAYKRKNSKQLEDPLLGPMNLMKFMNVSADKLKESLLNSKEKLGITREEVEEIVKKIYQNSYKKNFN